MAGNVSKIFIEVAVDGKGGIKVLRQIGAESEKTGKKGTKGFRNMSRSVGDFNKHMNLTRGLVAKLGAAFGLWKLWEVSKGFLDVAVQTENYKLRLNALLGSVSEGNRMFKEMSKFAGEVPFTYDQIMASATQLSGVMRGGIEEIKNWMPLIADLAAVSGLDIQTATEQIIRMYSAGAASADLFRERGITAMLGFQAGVSYSADETRKRLMDAWKDPESKFKDATKKMAKSWAGLVSMLGDKWFQFRSQVMESGPFQVMKERLGDLLTEIDRLKKTGQLDIWAADMADGVLASIDLMMMGFQGLGDAVLGLRASFGWIAEKWSEMKLSSLDNYINYLERNFPEKRAKEIAGLKAERAEILLNKNAGTAMAKGNINGIIEFNEKIDLARDKLAKLRADMEARRGQRPESDTDLGAPGKTTIPKPEPIDWKKYWNTEEGKIAMSKALAMSSENAHEEWRLRTKYSEATAADIAKHESIMADFRKARIDESKEAYAAMYEYLQFEADGYYEYRLSQIKQETDAYAAATGDQTMAYQMYIEKVKDLDKERLDAANKNNQYLIDLSQRTAEAMEQNFSDFYFDVMRGEFDDLGDYADAMLKSIQRATADVMGQMTKEELFGGGSSKSSGLISTIGTGIARMFDGGSTGYNAADWSETLWARGGAFHHGRVQPFARGIVIDRPTIFPMASGAGLMGEDGPEGVLPLTRTSSGDLGVKTVGATGGDVNIEVNVINNGEPVEQSEPAQVRFDGQKYIAEVHIDKMINSRSYRQANRQALR